MIEVNKEALEQLSIADLCSLIDLCVAWRDQLKTEMNQESWTWEDKRAIVAKELARRLGNIFIL